MRTDDRYGDSNDIDAHRLCSSKASDATSYGSSRDNGFRYRWLTRSVLLPSDATVEASKVVSLTVSSRWLGARRRDASEASKPFLDSSNQPRHRLVPLVTLPQERHYISPALCSSCLMKVIHQRGHSSSKTHKILNCGFRVRDKVKKAILTKSFRELRTHK